MNKYRVVERPLGFSPGDIIALDDQDAHRRRHALKPIDGGRYEVTRAIELKVGSEFATDRVLKAAEAEPLGGRARAEIAKKVDRSAARKQRAAERKRRGAAQQDTASDAGEPAGAEG